MNACSEDVVDMLVAESSLGLIEATNLFIGKLPAPASNTNSVAIIDSVGYGPQLTLDTTNNNYHYCSVQILVRNKKYLTGKAVIDSIMNTLHSRANEIWNGALYTVIQAVSEPFLLQWDDNQNAIFVVNINLQRR